MHTQLAREGRARARRAVAKCAARALSAGVQCASRVLLYGQILFRAATGTRGARYAAVWEVGYASAGERTLSGSTPALLSPPRSARCDTRSL